MHTELFLKDEKVIAKTSNGLMVFTNRRILYSKDVESKPTSILLESIKRLELVNKRSALVGFISIGLFLCSIVFILKGNILLFALSIIATAVALGIFYFKARRVLRIYSEQHRDLVLSANQIDDDPKEWVNRIECARFERLNQLFKSNAKAKDAENPKTIKISA